MRFCDRFNSIAGSRTVRQCGYAFSALFALCIGIALVVGCSTSNEGDETFIIAPAAVSTVGANQVIVFTAIGRPDIEDQTIEEDGQADITFGTNTTAFLPLEWSVRFPHLGFIAEAEGFNAVYITTDQIGQQIINVRDQRFAEGVAVVDQIDPATLIVPEEDTDDDVEPEPEPDNTVTNGGGA